MNLVQANFEKSVAGAKIGEQIYVILINGRSEKIILSDITRNGIEGFDTYLKTQPLTFFPYTSILKITKYTELT